MQDDREHVISVVLNHEEWKALVRLQPQPVTWLRQRIEQELGIRNQEPGTSRDSGTRHDSGVSYESGATNRHPEICA
jgi:hypothetical protein